MLGDKTKVDAQKTEKHIAERTSGRERTSQSELQNV